MTRKLSISLCVILAVTSVLCAQKSVAVDSSELEKHILTKPKMEFPHVMCGARIIGTVVLDVVINTQGKVIKETVISGPLYIQKYAVANVKQWTFSPFNKNGHAVSVRGHLSILIDTAEEPKKADEY